MLIAQLKRNDHTFGNDDRLNVAVAGANGAHDAVFASTFEDVDVHRSISPSPPTMAIKVAMTSIK